MIIFAGMYTARAQSTHSLLGEGFFPRRLRSSRPLPRLSLALANEKELKASCHLLMACLPPLPSPLPNPQGRVGSWLVPKDRAGTGKTDSGLPFMSELRAPGLGKGFRISRNKP